MRTGLPFYYLRLLTALLPSASGLQDAIDENYGYSHSAIALSDLSRLDASPYSRFFDDYAYAQSSGTNASASIILCAI